MRITRWLKSVVVLLALVSGASLVHADVQAAEPSLSADRSEARVGWWVGGFSPDCPQGGCPHAYSDEVWGALRETDSFLGVGLTYTQDFGPGATRTDLTDLISRALDERVEVMAWILVPPGQGTFANENNAEAVREAVEAFYAWKRERRSKITEVVLDLEIPVGYQPVVDAVDPDPLLDLHTPNDPAHQCEAIRTTRETIAWADAHGLRLTASPVPFALDDLENGDLALADTLDAAPIVPGFHDMYVQAYRTYSDAGPDYVAQYFRLARQFFGSAGEVTLGDTTMSVPYDRVEPLIEDVRLLSGLGASRIPVFNLEGSLAKYGASGVRRVGDAVRDPMTATEIAAATAPDVNTAATREFFGTLDTLATTLSTNPNPYPASC